MLAFHDSTTHLWSRLLKPKKTQKETANILLISSCHSWPLLSVSLLFACMAVHHTCFTACFLPRVIKSNQACNWLVWKLKKKKKLVCNQAHKWWKHLTFHKDTSLFMIKADTDPFETVKVLKFKTWQNPFGLYMHQWLSINELDFWGSLWLVVTSIHEDAASRNCMFYFNVESGFSHLTHHLLDAVKRLSMKAETLFKQHFVFNCPLIWKRGEVGEICQRFFNVVFVPKQHAQCLLNTESHIMRLQWKKNLNYLKC